MPSYKARMEYIQSIYKRYHKSSKEQKGQILREFCHVCRYNRKYAIRLLNGSYPQKTTPKNRKRVFHYKVQTIQIAEAIWKASGYLCGQRLKGAIPLWLPAAHQRFHISADIEQELLSISSRQLDNRLKDKKKQIKKRIYSTTRPGSLLKHLIPIRTRNWDIRKPGFLEIDLVAHCGNSADGQFVYTLNTTDIRTGWVERTAVMGRGQTGVLNGLFDIKNALPFRLRGIDSDNGEEFINYHLLDFCIKSRPRIAFTRGRPYKKDDNAHIEQKNWTHVRQFLGWDRYDTPKALDAISDLYDNELRLFQNLFQPSVKLTKKIRVGSKLKRVYDKPKTPLQRVMESRIFDRAKIKKIKELSASLDPFTLSQTIDSKLENIYKLASQKIPNSKTLTPHPASACFRFSRKTNRRRKMMATLLRQNNTQNSTKRRLCSVTS